MAIAIECSRQLKRRLRLTERSIPLSLRSTLRNQLRHFQEKERTLMGGLAVALTANGGEVSEPPTAIRNGRVAS